MLVSQDLVFRSKASMLHSQASVIANTIAQTEKLSAETVRGYIEPLDYMSQYRVLVTDQFGRILYDSDDLRATEGRYAMLNEVVAALKGYDVATSVYREDAFHSRAAVPVLYRDITIGCVYLYEHDTEQARLLTDIQQNLRSISLVVCVAALLMSIIFSKALTRRIAELLRAIRRVREGEYSHRVDIRGRDELSQLAGEFNQLTGRIQTTEEVRRRFVSDASHELKTPLASIRLLTDSILQADHMDSETAREFLTDIGDEAERLTRITEKLLTLTRLDTAPAAAAVPVDVGAVVERVEHMLTPLARAVEVGLELRLQPGCLIAATEDELYQIAFNLIPQIGGEQFEGYTSEEMKMQNEGRKIMHLPELRVSCTCVRVPVIRSHSESITIEFDKEVDVEKARALLAQAPGVRVVDDLRHSRYPMPLETSDQDLVFVGRLREDISDDTHHSLTFWCCGDQVRKGAATNAVQIAELFI